MTNFKKFIKPFGSPAFLCIFFAVWAAVIMLSGIRFGDLSGYDDAAYAHEAKVMLQTGDWWTLSLNGNPDFDKPPLFIWFLAISFKIFGITDFAAKVPGIIFGWATILLIYFLAKELFSEKTDEERTWLAVSAMFSLLTTQYFLKYSSHAMTDVPFTFFFTLAIYFYLRGLKNNIFLLASGIATGSAMLMRSPMGFFPIFVIFAHLIFTKRFKTFLSPYFFGFLVLSAAIPASWYFTEYKIFGDVFFERHFANFAAHSASAVEKSFLQKILWYFEYVFLLWKLYLPWCPLMFYGLFLSVKKIKKDFDSTEILLFIWFLVIFVPFSLAESKVLRYILPVFPVFAIYSACALRQIFSIEKLRGASRYLVLLMTIAGIFIAAFPNYQKRAEDMKVIAPFTDRAAKADERIILYTFGGLHWNFQTQLIWYGQHNTLLIKDFAEINKHLDEKKELIIVMDKNSFSNYEKPLDSDLNVIGESERFICFRLKM